MPVLDQRRVSTMVDFVLNDPSAVSRPFDLMDDTFHAVASEDEFRAAFDLVVKLLREMILLERIESAVKPRAEVNRRPRLFGPTDQSGGPTTRGPRPVALDVTESVTEGDIKPRRRNPAPPQPLPLFPRLPVTRPPGDGFAQRPTKK